MRSWTIKLFDLELYQAVSFRNAIGLSIWLFVSFPLSRYILDPEDFFIKKFRRRPNCIRHKDLLVRAFIGMGVIAPCIFVLGMAVIVWDIYPPTLWLSVQLISSAFMGPVTYLYFRLLAYRAENPETRKQPTVHSEGLVFRRVEPNALLALLLNVLTFATIPLAYLSLTIGDAILR